MRLFVYTKEVQKLYNRFLFIKDQHLFEEHKTVLGWFAEYEDISYRLANRIIQIGRLNSNKEL